MIRYSLRRLGAPSSRVLAASTASTTVVGLPVVLLSALAVLMGDELSFLDEATLGVAVGVFFGATAVSSVVGGRVSEAKGAKVAMASAVGFVILSLLVMASVMNSVGLLVASILGGVSNGVAQPAANLGIARGVRLGRQGFAFGVKQAAVPLSSLLAGLAMPVLGLTVGWRWTFLLAVIPAVVVLALIPLSLDGPGKTKDRPKIARWPDTSLLFLALGTGLGAASSNSMAAFTVVAAVDKGFEAGSAGILLAGGSLMCVLARIVVGRIADGPRKAGLNTVIVMLTLGSASHLLLALGTSPAMVTIGTLIAFGVGWGWPGLLVFSVVKLYNSGPAAATGVTMAGGAIGAVVGPMAYGVVAARLSFTSAWLMTATFAAIGAIAIFHSRRRIAREEATLPVPA